MKVHSHRISGQTWFALLGLMLITWLVITNTDLIFKCLHHWHGRRCLDYCAPCGELIGAMLAVLSALTLGLTHAAWVVLLFGVVTVVQTHQLAPFLLSRKKNMNQSVPSIKRLHFPRPFTHEHPEVQDVNQVFAEQIGPGQRTADWVANTMGSWKFIIIQSIILTCWLVLNVVAWFSHWDPYPFILMNLVLSMQAAYSAPIIMMSQNRQAAKDRIEARNDFLVNQKAEEEIRAILEHLDAQNQALVEIHQQLTTLQKQHGIGDRGTGVEAPNP